MKPIKPWQNWVSIDLTIYLLMILCMAGLAILGIFVRG